MFKNIFSFRRRPARPEKEEPVKEVKKEEKKRKLRAQVKGGKERQHASQIILDAKAEALNLRQQVDSELRQEKQRLVELEERLVRREEKVAGKLDELENKARLLQEKAGKIQQKGEEIEELHQEELKKLSEISGLSSGEAEKKVLLGAEERMKSEIMRRMKKMEATGKEEMEKKANEVLATVIQRYAASHVSENTTTAVHLSNDDMKGRIIGKEGRNIRALENVTGCEILVDETPGVISVSGFSPLRRQVAKIAIEKLMEDGRIQPARIEETVAKAKKDVAKDIKEAGEEVVYDLGITDLHPNLVQLIGRLKYRTSYGQSILQHSWEAARVAVMLAEELKADVNVVKKATLLHDIGKAVDHEVEGDHVEIGVNIMKKFGVSEDVIKASMSHHEDYPYESVEAIIVQVADAISASRPGARKESYEEYVKRMEDLERIATSYEGVEKAYAIAAGREVRVFVKPKEVDDLTAAKLAQDIAKNIEQELKYPGEVNVNVVRELRAEAKAK